ncbi:MAG: VCBS repeat-containing protein [Planctomycetes bacterium]|nr:VCBS repeat-containing protein [Planctomycetota bacterium]
MTRRTTFLVFAVLVVFGWAPGARAQLFENLKAFGSRLDVGDPAVTSTWDYGNEGPKDVAAGDLNGDGAPDLAASNLDGSITVYLNKGDGSFLDPRHLGAGVQTLRDLIIADLTGDGRPDVASAAPQDGAVVLFENLGGGSFSPAARIPTWVFARALAAGDFDGDGALELAVAGSRGGVAHFRRTPGGTFVELARLGGELDAGPMGGWSKPVYSLKVLRQPGAALDELIVTHAWSGVLWVLGAGASGVLEVKGAVPGLLPGLPATAGRPTGVFSLDAAPILQPAASGVPDLVTVHRDLGVIHVRRAAVGPERFSPQLHQVIPVPGMPRAVRIVDLDSDGWLDIAVVLRFLDRVVTYRNEAGNLVPATEMPTGRSPREIAVADFNRDGVPDVAVANRLSSDLSVLLGHAGQVGFSILDQVYLVDGEVAGLVVLDMNGDGRDDVVQLHRASGDFSVRHAGPDGSLAPPVFYSSGAIPGAQSIADVNNDGLPDVVVANLGVDQGYVTVRLGQPGGGFGPERRFELPEGVKGRLFAVEAADFDGDGAIDLATGFFDCRISFWKGSGDGTFTPTTEHFFVYESRVMAAGDFDQDGDVDLAGAGYAGHLVVVENRGDLLTTPTLTRVDYPPPSPDKFGTEDIKAVHFDADDDLDLVIGSGHGAMIYQGLPGMDFHLAGVTVEGTEFPASGVAVADLDGNGTKDLAVSCQVLSCLTVLTREAAGGKLVPAATVDVPAGRLLAAGDLDGDGHADLVGSGEVLWTALSSRRAKRSGPPVLVAERTGAQGLVINEVLSLNDEWPLAIDGNRTVDWAEIFNGAPEARSLARWRLVLVPREAAPGDPPLVYAFPPDAFLGSGAHRVVVFATNLRSPYHTGFRLPGAGGTLTLLDPSGAPVDEVAFPPQRQNLSYARYRDGLHAFVYSNFPSPGLPNADNGAVPPVLELKAAVSVRAPASPPSPGAPVRFEAEGSDDVGIVSASVLWQRTDVPDAEIRRVVLYDDGMHDDGAMQDGRFAGVLEPGLPAGAEIRFQAEAKDLSEHTTVIPDGDGPLNDGEGAGFYTLALSASFPRVELSEVVARNESGLRDERGGTPDWVEVRSCASGPVPLDGVFLSKRFPADEKYTFPQGKVLQPGEHFVVFCDGASDQGPLHAPFTLKQDGDRLFLGARTPSGAEGIADVLEYGPQVPDRAFARQGCGGPWRSAAPTPGTATAGTPVPMGDADASGVLDITDPIVILHHLFLGGPIACRAAGDSNGDGALDISDAVRVLMHLFGGGPPPVERATGCLR